MRCATHTPTQCNKRAEPDSVYCRDCREARQAPIMPGDLKGIRFVQDNPRPSEDTPWTQTTPARFERSLHGFMLVVLRVGHVVLEDLSSGRKDDMAPVWAWEIWGATRRVDRAEGTFVSPEGAQWAAEQVADVHSRARELLGEKP